MVFIEINKGNPSYKKYQDVQYATTILNLMELYYALLRIANKESAEKYYQVFRPACIPISDTIIKEAMEFRLAQRKQKNLISYVDCLGYICAMHLGILFVSGEKHFKDLKNVEFVK